VAGALTYQYQAKVVRVIDGDTVVLDVDLGFGVWLHGQNFRLLGCNAREKADAGGSQARMNLMTLLPVDTPVLITSVKPDKYGGRYDAQITLPDGADLSTQLISTGWAAAWNGTGTKPVPPWPRTAD
jgi:micrococcal nuclease